jgi:hypothetical protein
LDNNGDNQPMYYPSPTMPPTLSFEGLGDFLIDGISLGSAPVVVRADATGRILCWCLAPPLQLRLAAMTDNPRLTCKGGLNDGRSFDCPVLQVSSWPSNGLPTEALPLRARQFVIGQEEVTQNWAFTLTNLMLPNFSTDIQPVSASHGDITATLIPDPDYSVRMNHLRALKGTDVTVTLRLVGSNVPEDLCALAYDLCLILSVLTGQKVSWTARQTAGTLIFEDRITKPCSGWPVNGRLDKVLGKDWGWGDLLSHTLNALPLFRQRSASYPLRNGLIDAWIDARIETDFLETRCLRQWPSWRSSRVRTGIIARPKKGASVSCWRAHTKISISRSLATF